MTILDKKALIKMAERKTLKYVFFASHRPTRRDGFGEEIFSQWHPSGFEIDGRRYATAEHYMMAEKARLFGDAEAESRILKATSPSAAKAFGREVRGFAPNRWEAERVTIITRGNIAKFQQNAALGSYLVNTGERILVEATPRDAIWGIGVNKDDPRATQPSKWPGLNLLGFALMAVRNELRAHGADG